MKSPSKPRLEMRAHGATRSGAARASNEDQFVVATLTGTLYVSQSSSNEERVRRCEPKGHLLMVADGLGGGAIGEAASRLTLRSLQKQVLHSLAWLLQDLFVTDELKSAVRHADRVVSDSTDLRPDGPGVGATVTVAYVIGESLYLAHVGHGRCYLWRGESLLQLTRDHTVHVPRPGMVPALVAETGPPTQRHYVTNAIGAGLAGVSVEVHEIGLLPGDVLVLCTDGLTEVVDERAISAALGATDDPVRACERLIGIARAAGGADNVTVVVARFDEVRPTIE